MTARVIAVANQKGGVGKSTTAINLGAALALMGERTLIVDIDPQSNCTSGFGIDERRIERSIYDVLLDGVPAESVVLPGGLPGLDVLPSSEDLAGAEAGLGGVERRGYRLKTALAPLLERYRFILIDCPPSLGLLTVNALTAAPELLIPMQAEYYSLMGLSQLSRTVERVRGNFNPDLHISGLLVTMFDGRTRLAIEVLDDVNAHFPGQVYQTQIPRNIRLSEAPSQGKPAVLLDPRSRGALAYQALAQEIAGA
jgi:chromosome partitioning protein